MFLKVALWGKKSMILCYHGNYITMRFLLFLGAIQSGSSFLHGKLGVGIGQADRVGCGINDNRGGW